MVKTENNVPSLRPRHFPHSLMEMAPSLLASQPSRKGLMHDSIGITGAVIGMSS